MVTPRSPATCPSSGCSSPVIIRNSVVLPAPLGPTMPTFSPFWSAAGGLDEEDLVANLLADVVETNHVHHEPEKKSRLLLGHGVRVWKSVSNAPRPPRTRPFARQGAEQAPLAPGTLRSRKPNEFAGRGG